MSLPPDIAGLLRDEAYMSLGRTVIIEAIDNATTKIDSVQDNRPAFGILSSRKNRNEYGQALQFAVDERAALEARLSKIETLEAWIRSLLRPKLRDYIRHASPSFGRGKEILCALDQYAGYIRGSTGYVQAMARELRNVSRLLSLREAEALPARTHADLREAATNLDCLFLQLEISDQRLKRAAVESIFSEVTPPRSCFSPHTPIVERILNSPAGKGRALAEKAESELRDFLATSIAELLAQADVAREYVACIEDEYIDNYWNQLRAYAQTHYVVERDLDEVLLELTHRRLNERQNEVRAQDPFLHAR